MSRADAYALATSQVPLRRPATAEEVASVCRFLASDESSYVSGVALPVGGGGLAVDISGTPFGTS